MIKVKYILEDENVIKYLKKRNLLKQYKKTKDFILNGNSKNADLKLREPKSEGVYYFRIN